MSGTSKGDWNPGAKYRAYLNKITDILSNGEQRTVRDCYYALEARGFPDELIDLSYHHQLEKHHDDPEIHSHPDDMPRHSWQWEFEYRFVKRAVKRGRRAGYIDPSQIIDASRAAETRAADGWTDPEEFINDRVDGIWNQYWENFWNEQDVYLEIWLEKQSLASVFQPICNEYNVRLEATRGDWSDSKVYEACQRLIPYLNEGRDVRILYFGDYNPSGFHAPVSILDTMGYYGIDLARDFPGSDDRRYYDVEHGFPAYFEADDTDSMASLAVERLALTTEQIARFDLPENPVPSSTDKDETIKAQFQRHVSEGRDVNVELNALKEYHRDFLGDLIRDGIEQHIDEDAKHAVEAQIRDRRDQLSSCITIDRDAFTTGEGKASSDERNDQ